MPNSNNLNGGTYRYGMNGMEQDAEVKGNGNSYTSYWRQYDPRLGRWMSDEPKPVAWESGYAAFRNNPIIYADPSGDWPKIGKFLNKVFGGGKGGKVAARTPSSNGGPVRNLPGANYSGSATAASATTTPAASSISGIKSSFINFLSNDPVFVGMTIAGNWLANHNFEGNYRGNKNWHGIMLTSEFGKVATQSDEGHVEQEIEIGAAAAAMGASAKSMTAGKLPPNATKAETMLPKGAKAALPIQTDNSIEQQRQTPHRQNNTTPSNTQKENLTLKATRGKYKEVYYFNSVYWGITPEGGYHNVSDSDFIGKLKESKLINTRQGMYK